MKGRTSVENIFCKIITVMNNYYLNVDKMVGFTSSDTVAMMLIGSYQERTSLFNL